VGLLESDLEEFLNSDTEGLLGSESDIEDDALLEVSNKLLILSLASALLVTTPFFVHVTNECIDISTHGSSFFIESYC